MNRAASAVSRARVSALVRHEWRRSLRDTAALVPVLLFPLLFSVVLPGVSVGLVARSDDLASRLHGIEAFLDRVSAVVAPGASTQEVLVVAVTVYVFAPLFLLIPVIVATTGASAAFVGERERRTLDGLLYGPASVREIYLAKTLASVIPAVLLTWVSFLAFTVVVSVAAWPVMGRVFFPDLTWLFAVVVLVPLIAFIVIGVVVLISTRARSVQSAQGVSVFFVLPVVASIISQATGAMLIDRLVVAVLGAVLVLAAAIIYRVMVRMVDDADLVLKV